MELKNKLITILVPCYNEGDGLPLFYKEISNVIGSLNEYKWEVLFVNDGSKDDTAAVIELIQKADNRVTFVNLSRNFGKESAMLAGFDFAKGDAVIIMDADLQDPPSLIPEMIKCWEDGYDDIYAKRRTR